jgi:hypothetical protein
VGEPAFHTRQLGIEIGFRNDLEQLGATEVDLVLETPPEVRGRSLQDGVELLAGEVSELLVDPHGAAEVGEMPSADRTPNVVLEVPSGRHPEQGTELWQVEMGSTAELRPVRPRRREAPVRVVEGVVQHHPDRTVAHRGGHRCKGITAGDLVDVADDHVRVVRQIRDGRRQACVLRPLTLAVARGLRRDVDDHVPDLVVIGPEAIGIEVQRLRPAREGTVALHDDEALDDRVQFGEAQLQHLEFVVEQEGVPDLRHGPQRTVTRDPAIARKSYVEHGHEQVPGWFGLPDTELFDAVDRVQRRRDVHGDFLEVGVYLGRSAVLLGFLARPGERIVVCDVFDSRSASESNDRENATTYGGLTRQQFEENYRRYHADGPEVFVGTSREFRASSPGARFRFAHIDGSHLYDEVVNDIQLAREVLVDGGVVVFDDVGGLQKPGVTAAVWEAVASGGLVPLAHTGKLYATWPGALAPSVADVVSELRHSSFTGHQLVPYKDAELLIAWGAPHGTNLAGRLMHALVPPGVESVRRRVAAWRAAGSRLR